MTDHIYLAHHGIKGMKWGVRRFQNPDGTLTEAGNKRYAYADSLTYEGGTRTQKRIDKVLRADAKYGETRSASQQRRINKLADKAIRSYHKDIAKASSVGNDAAVRRLYAGQTYFKILTDPQYFNLAIADAAKHSNVGDGEQFTYNVLKDENFGGVRIDVNGTSNYYVYEPRQ